MRKRALFHPFAHKRLHLRLFDASFLRGASEQNAFKPVNLLFTDRLAKLAVEA